MKVQKSEHSKIAHLEIRDVGIEFAKSIILLVRVKIAWNK